MTARSSLLSGLLACVVLITVSAQLSAAQVDESSKQIETGAPRDTGASYPDDTTSAHSARRIRELELKTSQIRALIAGTLPPAVDPASLFDVELQDDLAVALEAARLQRLLDSPSVDANSPVGGPALQRPAPTMTGTAPQVTVEADLLDRRLTLDQARLDFYGLPPEQRLGLLQAHAQSGADAQSQALRESSAAEQRAREAEAERKRMLEAAQRARTEAQRTVAEERARLLAIKSQLAEQEAALAGASGEMNELAERTLTLRREVRQLLEARSTSPDTADALYQRLRSRLRAAREALTSLLAAPAPVLTPVGGREDSLAGLPAEISRRELDQLLNEIATSAEALLARQLDSRNEMIDKLYVEVQTLNADRLALLPKLSAQVRSAITGFTTAGIDQALAEVRQLMLVLAYHMRTAIRLGAAGTGSTPSSRVAAAGTAATTLIKIALTMAVLFWMRRFAAALLVNWRERMHEQARRARSISANPLEDLAAGLLRILTPTSWLLLIAAIVWVLPESIGDLLEVNILITLALWSFGGWLAVGVLDSLAKGHGARFDRPRSSDTDAVRLRSLRLVAIAIVAIGLLLSLSRDIVGRGTIYSWVEDLAWWMVLPLGLIIVHWWRVIIFERVRRVNRKGALERWVLAGHSGWRGLIAAATGGTYLFAKGGLALSRSWLGRFQMTRRLLTYLFRQQLDRIERSTPVQLSPLPPDALASLRSSTPFSQRIVCADDAKVAEVAGRIERSGCGAYAVVGERGSGRSTVLQRLLESQPICVTVDCPIEGSAALVAALARALELPGDLTLLQIAGWLDRDDHNRIIGIDNAHRLIRPIMGGLAEFDLLIDCARRHSSKCAWIFTLDRFAWRFYARARPAGMLFDEVISLSAWSARDLASLLQQRSKQAQIDPAFDRLIPEVLTDANDYDRLEALSRLATNYYELIWDYAAGNPAVALHTWLNSLGVAADGSVQVTPFKVPDSAVFDNVPDSAVFVLRAVLQLERASIDDVASATMLSAADVGYVLRFGEQCGYLEHVGTRYAITLNWYRPITRFLQRRHLLAAQ